MKLEISLLFIILCCVVGNNCVSETHDENIVSETNIFLNNNEINSDDMISNDSKITNNSDVTIELDALMKFLEEDTTDEIEYNDDTHRGANYFVCSGFVRALAKNANEYGIKMGGITLRDTPTVGIMTKHYHSMNYVIADDSFIIIEPQDDQVFYLDSIQSHHDLAYRYISIYPNAQMITNFGKGKETIDIDLKNYNESELVEKWRL